MISKQPIYSGYNNLFYRGTKLTISLSALLEAFRYTEIQEKYICFVICELCQTERFRWIDHDIANVSDQFRTQWCEKVFGVEPDEWVSFSDNYLGGWNKGTEFSMEEWYDNHYHGVRGLEHQKYLYRVWVMERVLEKKGDIQFEFMVELDDRED